MSAPILSRAASPFHEGGPTTTAPPTVSGAGRIHSEANTTSQSFNLTVNTSAPLEPVVADFRMMAAQARRSR